MNPRKMRNNQIYFATMKTSSKQLSGSLSKDLRKKYGKRSVRIVEGDTVSIIRGEFSGVDGKVTKISIPAKGVNVEGVKKEKLKGEKFDVYVNTTNIIITGLNSDDKWRMNRLEGKKATAARAENKPKVEAVKEKPKVEAVKEKPKVEAVKEKPKVEKKDTKKVTNTKTKKGDSDE